MNQKPFTRAEQMSCVYQTRTKGEGCGHCKIDLSAPVRFLLTVPRWCFCCGLIFLSLYVFACMSRIIFSFG